MSNNVAFCGTVNSYVFLKCCSPTSNLLAHCDPQAQPLDLLNIHRQMMGCFVNNKLEIILKAAELPSLPFWYLQTFPVPINKRQLTEKILIIHLGVNIPIKHRMEVIFRKPINLSTSTFENRTVFSIHPFLRGNRGSRHHDTLCLFVCFFLSFLLAVVV
jgi:hypothetical protein